MDLRILGMQWNQLKNKFQFSYNHDFTYHMTFKRILFEMARIFDLLHSLNSIAITAKL
jgi:hypothetical protein